MKNFIKLLSFIFLFSLISCGAIIKNSMLKNTTIEKGAIPPNFGKKNEVLICKLVSRNSIDRYMKKHIKNNYKGEYEFVSINNLFSSKYNDKNKYRYIFEQNTVNANPISGPNYSVFSYQIIDRKTNKVYSNEIYSSFFSKIIEAYSLNMEKVRNENN